MTGVLVLTDLYFILELNGSRLRSNTHALFHRVLVWKMVGS